MIDGGASPTRVDLPKGCFGVNPRTVRGPVAFGTDIRPGSWDVIGGEVVRNRAGIWVVRPVFVGKVRDEADTLWVYRQYRARCAVADTRPETTLAKRLQVAARQFGIPVWRAEYNTAPSTIPMQANEAEGVLKLDRTMTLDEVHYAFQTGMGIIIPQNYAAVTNGDFAKELCSSTRVPTQWQGKDCWSWEHAGPDHAFHAMGYLFAAVKKGNLVLTGGEATMGAVRGVAGGRSDSYAKQKRDRETLGEAEIARRQSEEFFKAQLSDDERGTATSFWEA